MNLKQETLIRQFRVAVAVSGITTTELCRRLHVSRMALYRFLAGKASSRLSQPVSNFVESQRHAITLLFAEPK